jgi:hypothetical protein
MPGRPEHRTSVAISGSRTFTDEGLVVRVIDRLIERRVRVLIGDARSGVDLFAGMYLAHMADEVYEAEWQRYGKRAWLLRNVLMVYHADELIAILADGPATPGTSNAMLLAQRKGIAMHVYHEGRWTSMPSTLPSSLEDPPSKGRRPSWWRTAPPWLKDALGTDYSLEAT